jgi:hypothetical protein
LLLNPVAAGVFAPTSFFCCCFWSEMHLEVVEEAVHASCALLPPGSTGSEHYCCRGALRQLAVFVLMHEAVAVYSVAKPVVSWPLSISQLAFVVAQQAGSAHKGSAAEHMCTSGPPVQPSDSQMHACPLPLPRHLLLSLITSHALHVGLLWSWWRIILLSDNSSISASTDLLAISRTS